MNTQLLWIVYLIVKQLRSSLPMSEAKFVDKFDSFLATLEELIRTYTASTWLVMVWLEGEEYQHKVFPLSRKYSRFIVYHYRPPNCRIRILPEEHLLVEVEWREQGERMSRRVMQASPFRINSTDPPIVIGHYATRDEAKRRVDTLNAILKQPPRPSFPAIIKKADLE